MNKISGFAFQIFFISSLSYANVGVDFQDSNKESSLCSELNGASIASGQLVPPIQMASAALCCQWCGEDSFCAAAVFSGGNCTFYNTTDFVEKPGHMVLLPNAITPVPTTFAPTTAVPTTQVPTTSIPTTAIPTTLAPTPVPTPAPPVCPPAPPVSGLLAAWSQTGGTYQDGTSQPSRYSVLNEVVTDALTGMQWQQTASTSPMNWTAAAMYCSEQTTGGVSGWRVPNIGELGTLVDYTSTTAPYIDPDAFPNALNADAWSGSPDIGTLNNAWFLGTSSQQGQTNFQATGMGISVRCVRSCYPTPPATRYTLASGVVTDTATGLIWQQYAPITGGPFNDGSNILSQVQIYCSELNLGGYSSGWRLPTVRELQTLVDYSQSWTSLMMDPVTFSGEPAVGFWSSSPTANDQENGWAVYFDSGIVLNDSTDNSTCHRIRCVR